MVSNRQADDLNLMAVSAKEYPIAHQAWADWRREQFSAQFVPKAYSVPSMFPPSTQAGADAYAEFVRSTRASINWQTGVDRVPRHPAPWGALSIVSRVSEGAP